MITLLASMLPGANPPGGVDPRVGTWTLTSAQSSLTPANKLIITDEHGDVHVVMSGETHLDFTAKADGKDTVVPGNPGFDSVVMHRIDKKQSEVTEKKNGAAVATVREQISKDGNELTITTTNKGHGSQTTVWTRGAGPKSADPVAGVWTEDQSKTRLRQGLTLSIEPDSSGGVHFSGDDNYTARFDGKPYDVSNSRNDTVALQLVDAHTIDATYRRNDQVTQRDHWVVSADGRTMTLTSTATLETGQHLAETLVFKKQ